MSRAVQLRIGGVPVVMTLWDRGPMTAPERRTTVTVDAGALAVRCADLTQGLRAARHLAAAQR